MPWQEVSTVEQREEIGHAVTTGGDQFAVARQPVARRVL